MGVDRFLGQLSNTDLGKLAFTYSRRLEDGAGRFAGVALVTMELDYFLSFYHSLPLSAGAAVNLFRTDGKPLVRAPLTENFINLDLGALEPFASRVHHEPAGSFINFSPVDGEARLVAYRGSKNLPLVVVASQSISKIAETFERRFFAYAMVLVMMLVLLEGVVLLLLRSMHQLELNNKMLAAEIDQRRHAEAALLESESRLRTITNNLPVLIAYVDSQLRYQFNNQAFKDWYGKDPEALRGQPVWELYGPSGYEAIEPYIERALSGEQVEYERTAVRQGVAYDLHVSYIPDVIAEEVVGFYVIIQDVTEYSQRARHLEQQALHDPLTGLPNRTALLARISDALSRAELDEAQIAVMFLDLDRFKAINDTYGHEAGDELLIQFGQRLQQAVRKADTVARLGGDEFVILLEGLEDSDAAHYVAEKIIHAMAEPFLLHGQPVMVTTSIGASLCDTPGYSPERLIKQADAAMYQAKQTGRNRFYFFKDHGL